MSESDIRRASPLANSVDHHPVVTVTVRSATVQARAEQPGTKFKDVPMPQCPGAWRQFAIVMLGTTVLSGCASSPFTMPSGTQAIRQQPTGPMVAQYREMNTRATSLDAQNQQLHAVLAQQQQQTLQAQSALQRSQQEVAELRRQLNDGGMTDVAGRGGARTRSASLSGSALPVASISGAEVVPDGDVVRIRLDGAQLFGPGRAELKPDVGPTLDRVAQALRSQYPGHIIGIEGHTDSDPITKSKWKSNHELAVARSVALFQALNSRGVPENQLFVSGYGANRPISSAADKSRNRRVEIVVYPESAG
jgi:flagellar motor protein MotB